MTSPAVDLFSDTRLKIADGRFVLIGVPEEESRRLTEELNFLSRSDHPFMVFQDGVECTYLLRDQDWENANITLDVVNVETGFRLVTIDRVLTWDVVGFMARITQRLAEIGISVGVLSSFSRDHLLIKDADLEHALDALNDLFGNSPGAQPNGL